MKYTKFSVLILLSSLLLVIIVGCSKSDDSSSSTDEQVTIHVLEKWPEPENAPYFEEAVEAFEEENPNISIELEAVADEPIKDKLRTALGGGDAPDIAFSWSGEFAEKFIRGEAALDLTDYFEDDPEWKESFLEASLIPYMSDDKNYGVPLRMNGKIFAYNKEIFDKHEIEEPETWDDFLKISEKLKDEGETPIILGNELRWPIIHYLTSFNQKLVPEEEMEKDYNKKGHFTDPGYVEALEESSNLKEYFNDNVNSVSQDMGKEMFYRGDGAMLYIETEEIPHLEDNMEDDWGMFKMPDIIDGEGNQNAITGAPEGFIVSSQTEHPDEAVEFLKFLTNKQNAEKMVEDLGWLSPISDAVNEDTASEKVVQSSEIMDEADDLALWLDTVVDSNVAEAYLEETQKLMNDDATPEEVMERIQQVAKEVEE